MSETDDFYLRFVHVTKTLDYMDVIDDVSFDVQPGRIIGLVGSNGIGKTTLLKLMAGALHTTKGMIVRNTSEISYLCNREQCYPWMKARDLLNLYRDMYDDFDYQRALALIDENKIVLKRKLIELSAGQSDRLFLILALCRKAKLYLLDEPMRGADPYFKKDFRQFLLEHISEDSTVIVSTHLLKDLEQIFDEVFFVTDGKVIPMEAEIIRSTYHKSVEEYYLEVIKSAEIC